LEKLQALAAKVSVFAPGSENFYKMGGLYEMWTDQFPSRLENLMVSDISKDLRAQLGNERGGREAAQSIIEDVLRA
jgi:malonate decarboxylase gamma subunit